MGPIEIVIIVAAVALVISVVTVAIVRKLKASGCSGCAGCPYAGSCKGVAHTSCHDNADHDTAKDLSSMFECGSCDEQVQPVSSDEDNNA